MKILEIEEFSAGIGGVSARVIQEAREFVKLGHSVTIFSSDIEEGTGNQAVSEESVSGIKIKRFPSQTGFLDRMLTKNVTYFNFQEELAKLNPNIVITHTIHPHSFKALSLCLKKNIPCFLVTHAPFNVKRKFPLNILTEIFNNLNKPKLRKFTKIISITKWENAYLKKLGIPEEKGVYIPNGIQSEFFSQKKEKAKSKVLFLGRIAPVKNLEVFIQAAKMLPNIKFDIVGMAEQDYLTHLKGLVEKENITNVSFFPPVFDLKEKIKVIDNHSIFILPSKREAMPQSLIEAMARAKIVISSKTDGGKELVQDGRTGFLFDSADSLVDLVRKNISGNKKIEIEAEKFASQFNWNKLIKKYEQLFQNL